MEKQPLTNARGVSCWSDIQGTCASHSLFPVPPCPHSLSWFLSVVGGAPSFVPHLFIVVPFVVGGSHRSFVASFMCCGGPPFVRCRGPPSFIMVVPPSFVMVVLPSFVMGCPPHSFVGGGLLHLSWLSPLVHLSWSPLSIMCGALLAPVIHPVSSGLQAWGWVLGCHSACSALLCSTCNSPHEQRLVGMVQGLGLVFIHAGLSFALPSPASALPCPALTVIVPWCVMMWLLAPMIHPVSSGSQQGGGC
jgi:hypothetical protein